MLELPLTTSGHDCVDQVIVAVKLGLPVAHLESGLRSFDRSMPEELEPVRSFWSRRAQAGAQLIASLSPILA